VRRSVPHPPPRLPPTGARLPRPRPPRSPGKLARRRGARHRTRRADRPAPVRSRRRDRPGEGRGAAISLQRAVPAASGPAVCCCRVRRSPCPSARAPSNWPANASSPNSPRACSTSARLRPWRIPLRPAPRGAADRAGPRRPDRRRPHPPGPRGRRRNRRALRLGHARPARHQLGLRGLRHRVRRAAGRRRAAAGPLAGGRRAPAVRRKGRCGAGLRQVAETTRWRSSTTRATSAWPAGAPRWSSSGRRCLGRRRARTGNAQLLELRLYDALLDRELGGLYDDLAAARRRRRPAFLRNYGSVLRRPWRSCSRSASSSSASRTP